MTRTVRPYAEGDLDDLLDAWEQATRLAHPFLTDDFIAQERLNIPQVYMPVAETWVLEQDGRVQGFVALIGNEVGAIFVRPALHGTGGGRALMDKARELRGELELEVFERNPIGRRFYERYGFEPVGSSVHEPTGEVALRLRLPADAPTGD